MVVVVVGAAVVVVTSGAVVVVDPVVVVVASVVVVVQQFSCRSTDAVLVTEYSSGHVACTVNVIVPPTPFGTVVVAEV